jgi:hypothetical protein
MVLLLGRHRELVVDPLTPSLTLTLSTLLCDLSPCPTAWDQVVWHVGWVNDDVSLWHMATPQDWPFWGM